MISINLQITDISDIKQVKEIEAIMESLTALLNNSPSRKAANLKSVNLPVDQEKDVKLDNPESFFSAKNEAETQEQEEDVFIAPTDDKLELKPEVFDIRGFPWDARIHSRTKTKNKDGSWRYARNVDQTQIDEIENRLAEMYEVKPTSQKTVEAPSAPPAPPAVVDDEFSAVLPKVRKAVADKKITMKGFLDLLKSFGVENLPQLAGKPHLIPDVLALIDSLYE